MNKQRRKRLDIVNQKLLELMDELEDIKNEEGEAFDNLPESIQESERGEQMSENCDTLDDWIDTIGEMSTDIEFMIGG